MVSRACNKTFIRLGKDIELSKYRGKTARHRHLSCVSLSFSRRQFGIATSWEMRQTGEAEIEEEPLHDKTFPIAR